MIRPFCRPQKCLYSKSAQAGLRSKAELLTAKLNHRITGRQFAKPLISGATSLVFCPPYSRQRFMQLILLKVIEMFKASVKLPKNTCT